MNMIISSKYLFTVVLPHCLLVHSVYQAFAAEHLIHERLCVPGPDV